jgi:hypothetical protein
VTVSVRRLLAVVLTTAAEAAAIALVVTGPRESLAFEVRLPLLVLAAAALLTAAPRPQARVPRPPVPMVTPWLVLSATSVIVLLTVKAYESNPPLVSGVFGGGATFGLLASGTWLIQSLRLPADGAEFVGEG